MDYSEPAPESQGGIDPLVNDSAQSPQSTAMPAWQTIRVKDLRAAGASIYAIGLAAAILSREEWSIADAKGPKIFGLNGYVWDDLVRQLVVAGFLEERSGLWHVARDHRP